MLCSFNVYVLMLVKVVLVWVFYWLIWGWLDERLRVNLLVLLMLLVAILFSQRRCSCTKWFILARLWQLLLFMARAVVMSVWYFCCVLFCCWWGAKRNRWHVIHDLWWNDVWLDKVGMKDDIWLCLLLLIILIEGHLCNTLRSLSQWHIIAPGSRRAQICLVAWHASLRCFLL